MKKILIAMTMIMTATQANAFDFNTTGTSGNILTQVIVQQVIQQVIPGGVFQNGNVRINGNTATNNLVQHQCYTKFVYDAQGNAKPFVSCY
jgi:hypothetical protein